jgi:hypothetical protein
VTSPQSREACASSTVGFASDGSPWRSASLFFKATHLDRGVHKLPPAVQGESAVSLARDPANGQVKCGGGAPIECVRLRSIQQAANYYNEVETTPPARGGSGSGAPMSNHRVSFCCALIC